MTGPSAPQPMAAGGRFFVAIPTFECTHERTA